jgi:peptide-methionine (S)-S-oxide reductase
MATSTKKIAFGGGCFWCTEAVFKMFKGVVKTTPGYAGGTTKNPTYEEVCSGTTGHAEVIMVEYDPGAVSLEKLLDVFFKMHDPTSVNRQGADVGSQYRSIILYTEEQQKKMIDEYIDMIALKFDKDIVTEVKALDAFYPAEDYHKNYYKNNPAQPYCAIVIRPKIEKIKKEFGV